MIGTGKRKRRVWAIGFLIALLGAGCATLKGEIPVEVSIPEYTYISPKSGDGIQDRLVVPVAIRKPTPRW